MDAKLKAKKLVKKFLDVIPHWGGDPSQADEINKSYAKRCALIALKYSLSLRGKTNEDEILQIIKEVKDL